MNISTTALFYRLVAALLFLAAQHHSLAGSATWSQNPMSTDWNTAENWMPTTVPNSPSDTATFGASDVTTLSINTTAVEVSTIVFNRGAAPFTITVDSGNGIVNLFITGNGIVNNSGVVQSVVGGGQAGVFLSNGATAGNLTLFGGALDG